MPARMDTRWMHDDIIPVAAAMCYWRGRLRVLGEEERLVRPRAVFYFGERTTAFRDAFSSAGSVMLGDHVHKTQSWLVVIPRPTPTGTWLAQQGRRSRAVNAFLERFTVDLRRAIKKAGCPPATRRRQLVVTRYSARSLSQESLEQGGRAIEALLVSSGQRIACNRLRPQESSIDTDGAVGEGPAIWPAFSVSCQTIALILGPADPSRNIAEARHWILRAASGLKT